MRIPQWFSDALESQFHGMLRIRWSEPTQQFHIEQKIGRRKTPDRPLNEWDDVAIRWRDGYDFVLSVTPGDRAQCPKCGETTKVPVKQMKFAKCAHCQKEFRACYWPLNDDLLQWLRYSDPYRGGLERMMASLLEGDAAHERYVKNIGKNEREAALRDNFNQIFEIQSVGYTGREKAWLGKE